MLSFEDLNTPENRELWKSSISRVEHHIGDSSIAIVSAYRATRPDGTQRTPQENDEAHTKLVSSVTDARKQGYNIGHIQVQGGYVAEKGTPLERRVSEKAIMLVANRREKTSLENLAKNLSSQYGQDYFLVHHADEPEARLVGTTSSSHAWIECGESRNVGKFRPQKIGNYFCRHMNREFSFSESIDDKVNERWGAFLRANSFFQRGKDMLF